MERVNGETGGSGTGVIIRECARYAEAHEPTSHSRVSTSNCRRLRARVATRAQPRRTLYEGAFWERVLLRPLLRARRAMAARGSATATLVALKLRRSRCSRWAVLAGFSSILLVRLASELKASSCPRMARDLLARN